MIVPSPYHRLNPSRAIFVDGVIGRELLTRLTPEILRLQSLNRDPITVYIDSPGGQVAAMETVLGLLKLPDQDAAHSCHIITAVVNRAASAAADLLSSGDYAVAYPGSTILFHGTRQREDTPLTVESTSALGWYLRLTNDFYAMALARKIEDRFSFRFMTNRHNFDDIRTAKAKPAMTDVECFIELVEQRLSKSAKQAWTKARQRHKRYEDIFRTLIAKTRVDLDKKTQAEIEGISIKAIVDFEIKANKRNPGWTFRNRGMLSVADDFFLLQEHLSAAGHERLTKWSTRLGKFVLSQAEVAEIDLIEDEDQRKERLVDKVKPILEPLWTFFVALCHALQDGENELTASDAYWLGLVDEIVGDRTLLSWRSFLEFKPDPPAQPAATQ